MTALQDPEMQFSFTHHMRCSSCGVEDRSNNWRCDCAMPHWICLGTYGFIDGIEIPIEAFQKVFDYVRWTHRMLALASPRLEEQTDFAESRELMARAEEIKHSIEAGHRIIGVYPALLAYLNLHPWWTKYLEECDART